ncbi:F-box protein SKIP22-like [Rhodamnia argentea]|uniref:F-box protein SKIP22-like n=1 Tax=Rhodamnia argentea TaxID=178133 RepID=A0A8B8NL48_9MYRT|nr:F-box protein SKIP22-like [Rhodamnia argentea]
MKLRLRSLESNDTLKLDVPNPCSLPQLRQILADRLSPAPGSSFRLSLNRTDELQSPNPADSLQSLGLASGDLVYYTLDPDGFASRGDNSSSDPNFSAGASNQVSQGHADMDSEDLPNLAGRPREVADSEMADLVPEDVQKVEVSGNTEDRGNSVPESDDFDGDGFVAVDGSVVVRSKFSEPYFLRRVLREELGGDGGDHRLLVIAVHAVMQESGFVAVDPVTGIPADRFHLPDQWPSSAFTMSLRYSLPVLVSRQSVNMPESVVLKFQSLGHFITIYGYLAKVKSGLRRICLDERRFAPTIDVMLAKGHNNVEVNEDGGPISYSEKDVFEFWKIVKDGLALPLLIDLTERVGLPLPSCFTCLPTELKLKIFELLPGIDLARVGGVCSELRYLTSNNDLWKQKYVEEFAERTERRGMINWKQSFAWSWEAKKKTKRESSWWQTPSRVDRPFYFRIRRDPNPFVFPAMIGGDYDRLPGFGVPSPFGQPFRRVPFRRNFTPNCNLGGLNG